MDPVVTQSPAEPAPLPAPAAKASVEQLVEDWFRRHFHGLGETIHQDLYNRAHAAKEELKQLLAAL